MYVKNSKSFSLPKAVGKKGVKRRIDANHIFQEHIWHLANELFKIFKMFLKFLNFSSYFCFYY